MTATSTHETTITADPDVPLIRITREFDAPPAKVFRAHTDPELYAQWIGPRRYETRVEVFDCRTGGSWRFVQSGGGAEYAFHGCFHEVRPSELIVQTFTYEGEPDHVSLERLVLEDLGDGRTRVHFGETYHAFNPVLRVLLERYVHRFISKDNDKLVKQAIEQGVARQRSRRPVT